MRKGRALITRTNPKKRATVKDVAELAQVGASTISRFLRGGQVSTSAAERVARAIKVLGYEPDENARALRSGRSRSIGVILPKISNHFFSQSVQLIEEEAQLRGCTVILLTHGDRIAQQEEHLATLRRYRADGIILTAAPDTTLGNIRSALPDTPVVAFDSCISSSMDSVLLDNADAARIATEHLLGHGYRDIACATGKPDIYSFKSRAAGYAKAMAAQGTRPRLIAAPDYEQLCSLLKDAFQGGSRPDAILTLSDFATRNVLTIYRKLRLRGSKRVPILCFDDFDYASLVDPPLSVIRQPIAEMVHKSLNLLFKRIEGDAPKEARTILVPGELIIRSSCGCSKLIKW